MNNTMNNNTIQIHKTCITYYDIIKSYIITFYNYIKHLLIIDEYIINDDDKLIIKIKYFILRYRRIIGIILLFILLYINSKCDTRNTGDTMYSNKSMVGGSNEDFNRFKAEFNAKQASKLKSTNSHEPIFQSLKEVQNTPPPRPTAAKPKFAEQPTVAAATTPATPPATVAAATSAKSTLKDKIKGAAQKTTAAGKSINKGAKAVSSKTNKIAKGVSSKTKGIRKGAYSGAAYVGNKFKDMSGWFYEILFSIALAIAICAIILPSLSFLIIGIICYFLFKKKMIHIKSM